MLFVLGTILSSIFLQWNNDKNEWFKYMVIFIGKCIYLHVFFFPGLAFGSINVAFFTGFLSKCKGQR